MKYIKAITCAIIICLLFCGCNFHISSSVDELISPISPFGDNAHVKNALDAYVKNGYSLKTPTEGDYISACNFYDIDGDGNDEAFAFYEPSDDLGTIDVAVIKSNPEKENWSVVSNISGDGKDIYSIGFEDVNNDNKPEVLICWDAISKSSNHVLSVYDVLTDKKGIELSKIGDSFNINRYVCTDLNRDGKSELLLLEISGVSSSVKAQLYSVSKTKFKLLGETKLDSHITSYVSVKVESNENDVRVYADAIGSDGSSMLTEVICWSDTYSTIVSPFYSYSTGLTKSTKRNAMINCNDLNDDGLIEIPRDYSLKKMPDQLCAVDWCVYKKSILIHSMYSLYSREHNYHVIIPDDDIDKIKVSYDEDNSKMTVKNKNSKKTVFSVMPVLKATYDEEKYNGYTIVLEKSGYYYLAKTGDDEDIKFSIDDLKNNIRSVN